MLKDFSTYLSERANRWMSEDKKVVIKENEINLDYYKKQLKRLPPISENQISIKLFGGNNQTNWLTLNIDSIEALREFFDICEKDIFLRKEKLSEEKEEFEIVEDLPEDYALIDRDYDVDELNKEFNTDYGCFFVKVGEGEYTSVYGCEGNIPDLDKEVHKVK